MTHDQILILAAPLFAVVGVAATGFFVMSRINRYGRVFNWPAQPVKLDHLANPHPKK